MDFQSLSQSSNAAFSESSHRLTSDGSSTSGIFRAGRASGNHLGRGDGLQRQASHGVHPGAKAATLLEFLAGLRGTLSVTFEEGTWAAWLYDLLKPHVQKLVV